MYIFETNNLIPPFRSGFDFPSNPSSLSSSMESIAKRSGKRGLKNSIGKIFSSKSKLRTKESSLSFPDRAELNSDQDGQRDAERRIKQKLLEDVIHSRTPFSSWNAPTILAWLEVSHKYFILGRSNGIGGPLWSTFLLVGVIEKSVEVLFTPISSRVISLLMERLLISLTYCMPCRVVP